MTATVILLAGARDLTEPGIVPATLADIAFNIADGPIIVRHGACPGRRSADQAASDWINEVGHRRLHCRRPLLHPREAPART